MLRQNVNLVRFVNRGYCSAVTPGQRKQQQRRNLSTKQQQQKKEFLSDQDAYPSEAGYVRSSPYESITIPNLTIDQFVWNNFRDWETKIATVSFVF